MLNNRQILYCRSTKRISVIRFARRVYTTTYSSFCVSGLTGFGLEYASSKNTDHQKDGHN